MIIVHVVVVENTSIVVRLIANHNALFQQSVANFSEIVKGFGMLPDKRIADFALRVPRCIACQV